MPKGPLPERQQKAQYVTASISVAQCGETYPMPITIAI